MKYLILIMKSTLLVSYNITFSSFSFPESIEGIFRLDSGL